MYVQDGANDKALYQASVPRILHLLKQPTKTNPSIPDLVQQVVREEKLGKKFLYRIAMRSYALQKEFADYQATRKAPLKDLGLAILASAIVNIEKESIAKSTGRKSLLDYARKNLSDWHRQVLELAPHLVICGGTFLAVWDALGKPRNALEQASTGMRWFCDPDVQDIVYLDCPHPSARYPLAMVHTYIMASASEVWERVRA